MVLESLILFVPFDLGFRCRAPFEAAATASVSDDDDGDNDDGDDDGDGDSMMKILMSDWAYCVGAKLVNDSLAHVVERWQ